MRRTIITTTLVSLALLAVAVAPAFAEGTAEPWFHLTSSDRPTDLSTAPAAAGVNEVQEIVVSPESAFQLTVGGAVVVIPPGYSPEDEGNDVFVTEPLAKEIDYPAANEANLQESLEGSYGKGDVRVTETAGVLPGEVSLRVESIGADADAKVTPIVVSSQPEGHAEQKTVTEGKAPGDDGEIVVTAANVGDATVDGAKTPAVIADTLPPGLRAVGISARVQEGDASAATIPVECSLESSSRGSCTLAGTYVKEIGGGNKETVPKVLPPFDQIEVHVAVVVEPGATGGENEVSVAGGESAEGARAPETSIRRKVFVAKEPGEEAPFGVENYELTNEEFGGSPDQQAGSHPFQSTTTIALKTAAAGPIEEGTGGTSHYASPTAIAKDLNFRWPPGLIGDPDAFPKCKLSQFFTKSCPPQSIVGVATTIIDEPGVAGIANLYGPLVNLEPSPGEAARFGFIVENTPVFLSATVRSGTDYGVVVHAENIPQTITFISSEVTVWGVPGEAAHDAQRGEGCLLEARGLPTQKISEDHYSPCRPLEESDPPAFLSQPTSCTGEPQTTVLGDSWAHPQPGEGPPLFTAPMPALDGCNRLPFAPSIKVSPDVAEASKPSGLTVDVHVPQEESLNASGLTAADPKTITVALPAGVSLNPSSADGLQACSEHLVGFEALEVLASQPGNTAVFSPYLPGGITTVDAVSEGLLPNSEESLQQGVNFCSNASKVAEVEVDTPVLPNPLKGFVYLAAQEANPFDSLLAMYMVVEDPVSGVLIKLAGDVSLCENTGEVLDGLSCQAPGQIVTTFENSPQAPFEDAKLHFFGGERAPLSTPRFCGAYTSTAAFTPWTATLPGGTSSGEAPRTATSTFDIDANCPGPSLPFKPTLTGGAENVNAGAFSPFTLTMSRLPGEQNLQSVEAKLPPGLSGILSNIELCPEPQANQGTCSENSKIGETTVSVGVGGEPFTVSGGKFYLTGPYNGSGGCKVTEPGCAPFGITFEVPAKAGPFDLANTAKNHPACDCVLVRGKIEVNPYTAALTIVSNPPGTPDAIPTMLEGIPLEIQHVNAVTTRGNFQFNPTNCNKMEVTGTIHSSEGATDSIGVPFQVTNCAALKFTPKFSVSTSGKTSKANGASLTAKVTEPNEPQGSQANLTKVKVELPKQLPSRLTTLQKACTNKQFELNPANCPSESKIGYAVVHTPLLPVPLEGPAIFVSHGGEAFPSLTMVLQGDNVTIDLVGSTFISKSGVTSTTFKTVPDQPFSSFSLTLPEGKYSALAANGNLCTEASKLTMPTEFIGQNGAAIHETTKIGVSGCAKVKTRAQKLAAALKVCRKDRNKGKKTRCETAARKTYGPLKKGKKASKRGK